MCRTASRNTQLVDPCHVWAIAADDHTGFHSYQLKTRSHSSVHVITNTGQLRSGKTLPGTWQRVQFTWVACAVPRPQPNRASSGWDGTGYSQHECTVIQSASTVWCHRVSMDHHPCEMFPTPCRMPRRIQAVLEAKEDPTRYSTRVPNKPGTRPVYLINCPVSENCLWELTSRTTHLLYKTFTKDLISSPSNTYKWVLQKFADSMMDIINEWNYAILLLHSNYFWYLTYTMTIGIMRHGKTLEQIRI